MSIKYCPRCSKKLVTFAYITKIKIRTDRLDLVTEERWDSDSVQFEVLLCGGCRGDLEEFYGLLERRYSKIAIIYDDIKPFSHISRQGKVRKEEKKCKK